MLSSCNWFHESKNVQIAIIELKVPNESNANLIRGADLAVEELNSKGGLLGRHIVLKHIKTNDDVNEGMVVAESLTREPNLIAVIGHVSSDVTLPVSSIYERNQILMITPTATSDSITENKRNYIFRMIPKNTEIGRSLASYFVNHGYKKAIVFYPRTEYGLDLANNFEKRATSLGINIVDRRSYYEQSGNYTDLFDFWNQHYEFDSILLIGTLPEGAYILNQIREAPIDVPIISGDTFANDEIIKLCGKHSEGLVAVAFAQLDYFKNSRLAAFREAYLKKYKSEPDQFSILGYDSILLVANAATSKKSLATSDIADYFHNHAYRGLVSTYLFDGYGNNIKFKTPYLMQVKKGAFTFIKERQ